MVLLNLTLYPALHLCTAANPFRDKIDFRNQLPHALHKLVKGAQSIVVLPTSPDSSQRDRRVVQDDPDVTRRRARRAREDLNLEVGREGAESVLLVFVLGQESYRDVRRGVGWRVKKEDSLGRFKRPVFGDMVGRWGTRLGERGEVERRQD